MQSGVGLRRIAAEEDERKKPKTKLTRRDGAIYDFVRSLEVECKSVWPYRMLIYCLIKYEICSECGNRLQRHQPIIL